MTRIVTSTYRYKRPPRKRKAVPLEGPAIVTKRRAIPSVGKQKPEPDAPPPTVKCSVDFFAQGACTSGIGRLRPMKGRRATTVVGDSERRRQSCANS